MLKGLLKILGALLLVVVVIGGVALLYLDRLAKVAIEAGGTHALGVNTRVDSVALRPLAGNVGLSGFTVDNPAGFDRPNFLIIDELSLDVSLGTLREDVVRAGRFAVTGVTLDLEKHGGGSNYDAILNNLERFETGSSGAGTGGDAAGASEGKRFVIEEVSIREIRADLKLVAPGGVEQDLRVEVPAIELRDVGSDGAMDMSEVTGVIVKAVLHAVLSSGSLPGQLAADLRDSLDDLSSLPGDVQDGALGAVRRAAEQVGDEVGKALDGLFGKKKD